MTFNKATSISFGVIAEEKLPISLAWIAGVFEKVGIEYDVIDFNYELYTNIDRDEYLSFRHNTLKNPSESTIKVIDMLVDRISLSTIDFLSVSIFSYRQYNLTKIFLQKMKAAKPSLNIIIGGPGIWYIQSNNNGLTNGWELSNAGLVDYYFLGNSEEVFVDYLNCVDPNKLIGVNSREKFKQTGEEEWTELIKKIQDKYIKPSYKKIPILDSSNKKKEIFITGANGCPGKCAFCSIRQYIPFPSYRDGIDVANECYEIYQQTGVTRFKRTDALANGHVKHFRAFNERIIELKKQDPAFTFEYNAMFVPKDQRIHDEEYYSIMAQAGCTSLDIGIESGSERLRKEMHKGYTDDQLDWHFEMCHKYNIKNNISIFVGFPTETDEDFNENLKMLDRYQKYNRSSFNEIQHCGKFVLYTKTYIYNNLDEYNIKITNHDVEPMEWMCTINQSNTLEKRLEREKIFLEYAKKLGYKVDVYDSIDK